MAKENNKSTVNYVPLKLHPAVMQKKPLLIFTGLAVALIVLVLIGKISRIRPIPNQDQIKPSPITAITQKPQPTQKINKSGWVNYPNITDIRDIEIDHNNAYLAGLGSLTQIDIFTKKIIKSYTMIDGLVGNTTTSVVKQNEYLWVGLQGGLNRINLKTGEIRSYTINEGLVNGSNIGLAVSGYDLWIGTFDGVSKYNPQTDSFINYKSELGNFATKWSVNEKLFSDNTGIWFIINANANSTGGLAYFDNATSSWKIYDVSDITAKSDKSRIDLFSLAANDKYVWITGGDAIYVFDRKYKVWQENKQLLKTINGLTGASYINSNAIIDFFKNKLYLYTNNRLIASDGGNTAVVIHQFPEGTTENPNTYKLIKKVGNNIYFETSNGLVYYDLLKNKLFSLNIDNIPKVYDRILTSFDNYLVVSINGQISLYNVDNDQITTLLGLKFSYGVNGNSSVLFDKIGRRIWYLDPTNYFEGYCGGTKLINYNLNNKQTETVNLPDGFKNCSNTLSKIAFIDQSRVVFLGDKVWIYNPSAAETLQWQSVEYQSSSFYKDSLNRVWLATADGIGIFENNQIKYQVDKSIFPGSVARFVVTDNHIYLQIAEASVAGINLYDYNLTDKTISKMDYPVGPAEYSPFEDWNKKETVNDLAIDDNNLFVASSRGLAKLNLKSSQWSLYTTKEGLMGNNINQVAIVNGKPWVIVNWGGLAGLK